MDSAFVLRNQLLHTEMWLQDSSRGSTNPSHSYSSYCTFLKCITPPQKSEGKSKQPVLLHARVRATADLLNACVARSARAKAMRFEKAVLGKVQNK